MKGNPMRNILTVTALLIALAAYCSAQEPFGEKFSGLGVNTGNLHLLSDAVSRSISPENFTGEKGKAAMSADGPAKEAAQNLGRGWKVSPYVRVPGNSTFTLAEIKGSGAIEHIWLTPAPLDRSREMILRFYWDGEETPSIECPLADFFTCGWQEYCQNNSLMVNVNPGSAFNCYWTMPFHKSAKVTLENINPEQCTIYYQIDYVHCDIPESAGCLHAQFRRINPLKAKDVVTILDGVRGKGHYVGTYLAWEVRSPGWWGEGEIKFYLDGDKEFPTIAGTGTEDYFCGSYNFDRNGLYREFTTPYAGLVQVLPPDICYQPGQRFGLYRWHIADPIRFEKDLKVTIQALGWKKDEAGVNRYLPLEDDISSVAFWYQAEPHTKFPPLPAAADLTVEPLPTAAPAEKQ